MNKNEIDKTDDVAELCDLLSDVFTEDEPFEAAKFGVLADKIREVENKG